MKRRVVALFAMLAAAQAACSSDEPDSHAAASDTGSDVEPDAGGADAGSDAEADAAADMQEDGVDADPDVVGTDAASDSAVDTATPDGSSDVVDPGVGEVVVTVVRDAGLGDPLVENLTVEAYASTQGGWVCIGNPCRETLQPWSWQITMVIPVADGWGCRFEVHHVDEETNALPVAGTTPMAALQPPGCGKMQVTGQPGTTIPGRVLDVEGSVTITEVLENNTLSGGFEGSFTVAYEPTTGLGDDEVFSVTSIRFNRVAFEPI